MTTASGELGVLTTDRAGIIQSWNDWLASATGRSEEDARGRELLSLVPPARADIIRAFLDEVLTTGTTRVLAPAFHHYLLKCAPRQPSRHFTEMQQFVTIAPLLSGATVVGAMVTIEDVTAQLERQRDLVAELRKTDAPPAAERAIEAVGAANWQLRGLAVRNLRQRASTAEMAHLLETLRRGHQDLNVVSSALQVLAANRDVVAPLIDLLSDPQADLRMHAALALGQVGDPVAVPALAEALDDPDANVRFHAIEALGAIGAGDAVERLAAIAGSGDFFLSFPAVTALSRADDPRVAPALTSLLDNELLRSAVVDTLAAIGDEDAVTPLVALLEREVDGDTVAAVAAALDSIREREERAFGAGEHIVDLARAALRPAAVAALSAAAEQKRQPLSAVITVLGWSGTACAAAIIREVGNPDVEAAVTTAVTAMGRDAVEPLIARLNGGERGARIAAANLLGGLGDRRAVPALVAALDGADVDLTAAAAAALARLGDPSALSALLGLFGHENAVVRQAAIAAINSIGAAATAARIRTLLDDPDPRVRASAVRVGGYFGFDDCIPGILRCVDDADEEVRRAAIEQLPVIDDPRAAARLVAALATETPRNRATVAHALRHVDAPEVLDALLRALDDTDPWVRYFAAGALAPRGAIEAVARLSQLAQADPAPHVRIAALEALTAIDAWLASEMAVTLVHDANPEIAAAALTAVAAGSHPEADDLLEQALKSGDPFLSRAAVRALPNRSTARAADLLAWAAALPGPPDLPRLLVESLSRIARSGDGTARRAAVRALVNLGTAAATRDVALQALAALPEAVVDELGVALRETSARTKLTSVEALARMRHPRASEALLCALDDGDPQVRRAAVAAFGRLGTWSAAAPIVRLRATDPDARVRRLADAMCRRHGWEGRPSR